MSFTQALNTIMVRLIKLKYAINLHLPTLDVTCIPNKHTWLDKTKKKQLFQRKNIKFKHIFKHNAGNSGNVNGEAFNRFLL